VANTQEQDLERLRKLIGREPTFYPRDHVDQFIKFVTDFAAKIGTTREDVYRQVELTCMSEDQVAELSDDEEFERAMLGRKIAREYGVIE
jgi:hypothetical protein